MKLQSLTLAQRVTRVCANYMGLVTWAVYYCSHKVLQACARQRLTRVPADYMGLITQPVYFCLSNGYLAFFWQKVTWVWGLAYTTRVLCISSNTQSLDLSKLTFALLYCGALPNHLKRCRKYGIKVLTIEIIKTNEINYYA